MNSKMTLAEKQNLAKRTKGMSEEEKRFSLQFIPTKFMQEEIDRRDRISKKTLASMSDAMKEVRSNMTLEERQELIQKMKSILSDKSPDKEEEEIAGSDSSPESARSAECDKLIAVIESRLGGSNVSDS